VEIGRVGDVVTRQKDAHVKVFKVDEAFVDILAVVAPSAFLKKEVDLLVNFQEYFCSKVFASGDVTFVVNDVLFDSLDKMTELVCQNAGLPEDILAGKSVGLELKDKRVKVLGDQYCHLCGCLDIVKVSHQASFPCQEDVDLEGYVFVVAHQEGLHLAE
jgi:hypothetical protein